MRAAIVHRFGSASNITYTKNANIPEIGENQLLIRVKASAVNPVDTYIRSGNYANLPKVPYIPGREGAGIVERVASDVKKFLPGDRVWFTTPVTGSCADFAVVKASAAFSLPEKISFAQGSTLGIAYLTAYRALFIKAKAQPGQTCFIHGASGGVGLAAVQLGKAHGLKVYGTAGSKEGLEIAKKAGVDEVFNHNEANYVDTILEKYPGGFDVILEMLANVNLNYDLALIAKFGHICIIGNRDKIEIDPRRIMQKESSVVGVFLAHTEPHEYEHMANSINSMLENGTLIPIIDIELPLSNLPDAHNMVIEKSASKGKIVINLELFDKETTVEAENPDRDTPPSE
uniref:Enoyl reductase (ER) domain-containing protein n=1 Tax=Panagrolaimus sp. PS1159 TaxID=55785 RepID=A0AC35FJ05_9BILA